MSIRGCHRGRLEAYNEFVDLRVTSARNAAQNRTRATLISTPADSLQLKAPSLRRSLSQCLTLVSASLRTHSSSCRHIKVRASALCPVPWAGGTSGGTSPLSPTTLPPHAHACIAPLWAWRNFRADLMRVLAEPPPLCSPRSVPPTTHPRHAPPLD